MYKLGCWNAHTYSNRFHEFLIETFMNIHRVCHLLLQSNVKTNKTDLRRIPMLGKKRKFHRIYLLILHFYTIPSFLSLSNFFRSDLSMNQGSCKFRVLHRSGKISDFAFFFVSPLLFSFPSIFLAILLFFFQS